MKNQIKRIVLLTLLLGLGIYSLTAQNKNETTYKAYLFNSEALWKQAIVKAKNPWQKALAHYGLLSNTMSDQNEDLFDEYVDITLNLLEDLEETNGYKADVNALRSSIYGFIMGYSPWKGMIYGPKSSSAIEKALKLGENSGIVWMVQGGSLFYTPESFGGDKVEAEKAYEKSILLFESANDTTNNWLYLNSLANLGKVYHTNGKKDKAIAIYHKALKMEPEFNWVSKVLLPQAQK